MYLRSYFEAKHPTVHFMDDLHMQQPNSILHTILHIIVGVIILNVLVVVVVVVVMEWFIPEMDSGCPNSSEFLSKGIYKCMNRQKERETDLLLLLLTLL